MSNLILYYRDFCGYCKKVRDFLEAHQIEIPLKNIGKDPHARTELLKKGGSTQVPCLLIDGSPLYESDDIIEWVKDNLCQSKP